MNIRDLAYFQELVRSQSYTQTAQHFGVSQPTISQSVARLERYFETPLLARHAQSKSLQLTASGAELLQTADEMLRSWDQGRAAIARHRQQTLRIGIGPTMSERWFPGIMQNLHAAGLLDHIQLIQVGSNELRRQLDTHQVDIAVSGRLPATAVATTLVVHPLNATVNFQIIATSTHPLTRKMPVTLDDCRQYPFIIPNASYFGYQSFRQRFGSQLPPVLLESDSIRMIRQLVAGDMGAALGYIPDILPGTDAQLRVITPVGPELPASQINLQYRVTQTADTLFTTVIRIIEETINDG